MAGTTPVTILKEAVASLTQALRQGVGHAWAPSIKLTKPYLISLASSVGTKFSDLYLKT